MISVNITISSMHFAGCHLTVYIPAFLPSFLFLFPSTLDRPMKRGRAFPSVRRSYRPFIHPSVHLCIYTPPLSTVVAGKAYQTRIRVS